MSDRETTQEPTQATAATEDVSTYIRIALDALVAALAAAGAVPDGEPPVEALNVEIQKDPGYRQARGEFREAFERLMDATPSENRGLVLDVEATANHVSCRTADVGWRLGLLVSNQRPRNRG